MKASNTRYANVHSIETFGAFDGPGVRYVLFLQGCPFQCQYCHNRDTWSTKENRLMSVEDIIADYKLYQRFYKKGGITVSGGEPLLQLPFLIDLFKACKALGIHTCLDTSAGCYHEKHHDMYETLLKYTDLVLLDIKHIDSDKHEILTGQKNDQVLHFARLLDERKIPLVIRHVLLPKINSDVTYLKKLRSFLDTLNNITAIDVLPYHKQGIKKWEAMGLAYPIPEICEPSENEVELAESILKSNYLFMR